MASGTRYLFTPASDAIMVACFSSAHSLAPIGGVILKTCLLTFLAAGQWRSEGCTLAANVFHGLSTSGSVAICMTS